MQTNPYSAEFRYTIDLMARHVLMATQAQTVRIASHSAEIAKAVVRRLDCERLILLVESQSIQAEVRISLGVETEVIGEDSPSAEAALFPFSLGSGLVPAGEPIIVAACENALSYKSLLHPGKIKETAFQHLSRLRKSYCLTPLAGLYSPKWMWWLILAKMAERWSSASWFRLEDLAMCSLIEFGPMWRLSYIVVFTGQSSH